MVAAIRDFPSPSSKRQLQRFLSMVSFYRRFLPHCDDLTLSLTNLLSSPKHSFELSADALAAFGKVKAALVDVTLLTHFSPDDPISLLVCACNVAVGVVHQQSLPDSTVSLAFFSRKPSKAKTRYSTFGRELPAVYLAMKHFRQLIQGREVTVYTDHKPLSFVLHSTSDRLNSRGTRQLETVNMWRGSDKIRFDDVLMTHLELVCFVKPIDRCAPFPD
nr:unnamed protein product [Spirometra erinaceieuropaei]